MTINQQFREKTLQEIFTKLFDYEAIRFGKFELKSGVISPFYIDLRVIISYPDFLKQIADLFIAKLEDINFDTICGVPYTALPIACAISLKQNIPMLIKRKEAKDYGTKKLIEGQLKKGERCLIIEDLITSGLSILETTKALEAEGLIIQDAIVLIDRNQGGVQNIATKNIQLHSVFKIDDILNYLKIEQKITPSQYQNTLDFLKNNQVIFK